MDPKWTLCLGVILLSVFGPASGSYEHHYHHDDDDGR